MRGPDSRGRRRADRLRMLDDDDPIAGFANLFDVAMVLAVALLVAMELYLRVPALLDSKQDVTVVVQTRDGGMEIVTRKAETLTRYRVSQDEARGEGVRLGTAYRLESGEVVYVPESAAPEAAPAP
jgi:hypothetical protein